MVFEFLLTLFCVPYLFASILSEYQSSKTTTKESEANRLQYINNIRTWEKDVIDTDYESSLEKHYMHVGYDQLWHDAVDIIGRDLKWYKSMCVPSSNIHNAYTLCYMIIMSYNKGKLPESVAKWGIFTVDFKRDGKISSENDTRFSETIWWINNQLNRHGIHDRVLLYNSSINVSYLTELNKSKPNRAIYKWERMVYPGIKIK